MLKAQSTAQSAHVKEALKEELDTFAAYERMTTDFDAVLRADYKELHHGGRYHKGKGQEFAEAMRDAHLKAFMMQFERAEGGWRFRERRIFVDLVGDLARHLRSLPLSF